MLLLSGGSVFASYMPFSLAFEVDHLLLPMFTWNYLVACSMRRGEWVRVTFLTVFILWTSLFCFGGEERNRTAYSEIWFCSPLPLFSLISDVPVPLSLDSVLEMSPRCGELADPF